MIIERRITKATIDSSRGTFICGHMAHASSSGRISRSRFQIGDLPRTVPRHAYSAPRVRRAAGARRTPTGSVQTGVRRATAWEGVRIGALSGLRTPCR
jgi:hypothetical protein